MNDGPRNLDGVTAAVSAISTIVNGTLTYRGYAVEELVRWSTFDEVSYLLWYGDLPSASSLADFTSRLRERRALPAELARTIAACPSSAHGMDSVRTAVSALPLYDSPGPDSSARASGTAIDLLARIPTIVAMIHRVREGSESIAPNFELDEAANFLSMVHGEVPTVDRARAFDMIRIVHADHELNASTFAARVAASTGADMYAAVVAALAALSGPLHGGAAEGVMHMLRLIGDESGVAAYVNAMLRRKQRVLGFGHSLYQAGDPRARIMKTLSANLARGSGDTLWFDISRALEEYMVEKTGLLPNVDLYSASAYTYLGFAPSIFTALFAMHRVSGWIAHILEQYDNNRLIRPRAEYIGVAPRQYVPIQERY